MYLSTFDEKEEAGNDSTFTNHASPALQNIVLIDTHQNYTLYKNEEKCCCQRRAIQAQESYLCLCVFTKGANYMHFYFYVLLLESMKVE